MVRRKTAIGGNAEV